MASVVLQQTTGASQFVENTTGQPVGVPSASVLSADSLVVSSIPTVNSTTVNATTVNALTVKTVATDFKRTTTTYVIDSLDQRLRTLVEAETAGVIPIPTVRVAQLIEPVVNGTVEGYDLLVRSSVQSLPLLWGAPYQGEAIIPAPIGTAPTGVVTVATGAVTAASKVRLMLVGTTAAAYAPIVSPVVVITPNVNFTITGTEGAIYRWELLLA